VEIQWKKVAIFDKETGKTLEFFFSSVNLANFANFSLNFTKNFDIEKRKKKH
jgi:hypothetical protein